MLRVTAWWLVAVLLLACSQPVLSLSSSARQPGAAKSVPRDGCQTRAGVATGVTRAFAEYEALLIIRQVTGNWPVGKDRIGPPLYDCRQGAVLWTCRAVAKVCRG